MIHETDRAFIVYKLLLNIYIKKRGAFQHPLSTQNNNCERSFINVPDILYRSTFE